MARTEFGHRLKQAFDNASNQDIADKLGVSAPAVQNYVSGRIPDGEKLILIASITNCDLHWLLTGTSKPVRVGIEEVLERRMREIVREELEDVGGEVGPIEPLTSRDVMLAPHLGEVGGGEDEEELPRRRTG